MDHRVWNKEIIELVLYSLLGLVQWPNCHFFCGWMDAVPLGLCVTSVTSALEVFLARDSMYAIAR